MDGITLITPTSDRPKAFRFCERWMQRAIDRFEGRHVQWIVVDDGHEPAPCTMDQQHLRREPSSNSSASFRGNLFRGLNHVRHEKILFIEDDDWYSPDYLNVMNRLLEGNVEIAGEARSKYYNIRTRQYLACRNRLHASLCQTGIRDRLVPWLKRHLRRSTSTFIDVHLWQHAANPATRVLTPQTTHCIGIKGLPGKAGIGIGHRLGKQHLHDPDGSVLVKWIGPEDAHHYLSSANHAKLVELDRR